MNKIEITSIISEDELVDMIANSIDNENLAGFVKKLEQAYQDVDVLESLTKAMIKEYIDFCKCCEPEDGYSLANLLKEIEND